MEPETVPAGEQEVQGGLAVDVTSPLELAYPQDFLDAQLIANELTQTRKHHAVNKLRLAMSRAGVKLAQPEHDRQLLAKLDESRKALEFLEKLAAGEGLPEPSGIELAEGLHIPSVRG